MHLGQESTGADSAVAAARSGKTPGKLEAVRLAKDHLGEVSPSEMATFIEATFGLTIAPTIVNVLLGTLRERQHLEQTRQMAIAAIEKAKAEQPQPEGKKPRRKKDAIEKEK